MPRKTLVKGVKKIVIKVGSSSVTENGLVSQKKIDRLVDDVCMLMKRNYRVAIVSSGAITAGAGILDKSRQNLTIPEKQAFAAVGQTLLMNEYRKSFARKKINVGQILLTEDDVKHRGRFLNARNTMEALLDMGVVPVVNENDSVVVKEIKFGDNDTLSAHVASIIDAELLVILSDIDGLYRDLSDPAPIEEVNRVTPEIFRLAGGTGSVYGTGGMVTKIKAAEMILGFGVKMIIAPATVKGVLNRIMDGEKIGTIFSGEARPIPSRKKWLSARKTKGEIIIDAGAASAVSERKKSLLASGVRAVKGHFEMGDVVAVNDESGSAVAKGIIKYSSRELETIKGMKTQEIKEALGIKYFEEVIHRDDIFVYSKEPNP